MSKPKKGNSKEPSLTHIKSKGVIKPVSVKSLPKIMRKQKRFLKEDGLSLKNVKLRNVVPREIVPPQTPNSEYEFEETLKPIPPFPSLHKLQIPYVREKGVKYCIEHFGNFFHCNDYSTNYLQFWFLDVITDCVWCLQDEYLLEEELQKVVLQWFLYFLDLMRNQKLNLSRKNFFTIFKEAILVAAEVVDEGCVTVPSPQHVFRLMEDQEASEIDPSDLNSSLSSIAINQSDYENPTYIQIEQADGSCRYELPPEPCQCDDFDLSTVYTLTESDSKFSEDDYIDQEGHIDDDMSFYKPNFDIPSRFLECFDDDIAEELSEKISNDSTAKLESNSSIIKNKDFGIYEVEDKYEIATESYSSSSQNTISINNESKMLIEQPLREGSIRKSKNSIKEMTDQDILKALTVQKLWEQRLSDMNDPSKGWIPTGSDIEVHTVEDEKISDQTEQDEEEENDDEWIDMVVKSTDKNTREFEDNAVLNFGVLWAIIEIVFKYFYESFQFSLVKMAFNATPEIITQKVNKEWHTLKISKVPLDKPKYEPKPSPITSPDKKTPEPTSPPPPVQVKSEQIKSPEKPKMTAEEEKALLAKLEKERLEQLQIEEEMKKMEENKTYLFPLMEGATDDLFRSIFPNWGKEKPAKK